MAVVSSDEDSDREVLTVRHTRGAKSFVFRPGKKSVSDMMNSLHRRRSFQPGYQNLAASDQLNYLTSSWLRQTPHERPVPKAKRSSPQVQSDEEDNRVEPSVHRYVKSLPDFDFLQRANGIGHDLTVDSPSRLIDQSHPLPRSSASTLEPAHADPTGRHRRVNLWMMSLPVRIPETREDFEVDGEEYDIFGDKKDKAKTYRVINHLGKRVVKEKKRKVKDGVVVYKGHPSWSIVLAFQVGLKHTSELLSEGDLPPDPPNGKHRHVDVVFELRATAGANTNEAAAHTSWIHHAPVLYKRIRDCFGISEGDFLESVAAESKIRELPSPGKSGALFYVTEDEEYFIKTISKVEERKLKEMLDDYYDHICKYPHTLLTRFLANFYMKTRQGRHIRLVAMGSIFRHGLYIDRKYDLKGSTLHRQATEEEKKTDFVTLKDLDLDTVFFEPDMLKKLLKMLEHDTAFLERKGIMDYSLLMGFSEVLPGEKTFEDLYGESEKKAPWFFGYQVDDGGGGGGGAAGSARSEGSGTGGNRIRVFRISLGIIDILQSFTLKKRVEFRSKTLRYCSAHEMSVNPPGMYRERFMNYMREKFQPLRSKPPTLREAIDACQ